MKTSRWTLNCNALLAQFAQARSISLRCWPPGVASAPGDYDNWFSEWATLAEKTSQLAAESLQSGRQVSAAKAFLRATEYWRQAIFFIRHDIRDSRLLQGCRSHRAAFRAALSQSQRLYDLLVCQKRFHRLAEADGAGGHCCALGASLWEAVVFDWIDQVLS